MVSCDGQDKGVIAYELHGNLYLNITNRCTLRCAFCPKFNRQWDVQGYHLRLDHEPEAEEILAQLGDVRQYQQVVFCGLGEPTQRLDTLRQVACELKRRGAYVRLNTDGLAALGHRHDVVPALSDCLDEVSVSMNAQNSSVYSMHCRPKRPFAYEHMLEFVGRAVKQLPHVSVSALEGLKGVDVGACQSLAKQMGAAYRYRRLGVVG